MRRSDFLPPFPPSLDYAGRSHFPVRLCSSLRPSPTPARGQGCWGKVVPTRLCRGGGGGPLQLLGGPGGACALVFDPGGTDLVRPVRRAGAAPALVQNEGSRE